ncbi:MAG: alpha amylase C-terminal domain-containing protein [Clostridia bacterium]|nr:alpha amylase C-terminal domain-containing protein [Clostridia bacterium]
MNILDKLDGLQARFEEVALLITDPAVIADMQRYVRELNQLYLTTPALYEVDDSWDGFKWLSVNDSDRSIVAMLRTAKDGSAVACCVNFTPVVYEKYRIGLPYACTLQEILCSDRTEYAGSGLYNGLPIQSEEAPCNDLPHSAEVLMPAFGCVYFKVTKTDSPSGGESIAEKLRNEPGRMRADT